jgi:DNA-binding response OmpR family regulator
MAVARRAQAVLHEAGGEVRVLVIEDCPSLARLVARALSEQGIATDVACDSSDAAAKFTVSRYDVAVVDANLAGIPPDKLRSISSDSVMVMMLGGPSAFERVSGLTAGADDYLSKPFHPPELVLRVRALGRRRGHPLPRVLRTGGIALDSVARTARRDGRPLQLTAKELGVLEALLAASPAYLSAEQLLEKVWDENADPFTKTVRTTIGRLRRKLGQPPIVETTIGMGYRITDRTRRLDFNTTRQSRSHYPPKLDNSAFVDVP